MTTPKDNVLIRQFEVPQVMQDRPDDIRRLVIVDGERATVASVVEMIYGKGRRDGLAEMVRTCKSRVELSGFATPLIHHNGRLLPSSGTVLASRTSAIMFAEVWRMWPALSEKVRHQNAWLWVHVSDFLNDLLRPSGETLAEFRSQKEDLARLLREQHSLKFCRRLDVTDRIRTIALSVVAKPDGHYRGICPCGACGIRIVGPGVRTPEVHHVFCRAQPGLRYVLPLATPCHDRFHQEGLDDKWCSVMSRWWAAVRDSGTQLSLA